MSTDGVDFQRRSIVQAHDTFSPKIDLTELDTEIRSQKAMGELVISYPGNGGRTSVVFKGKPAIHRGEVEFLPDK
jgi:hypothetical protein